MSKGIVFAGGAMFERRTSDLWESVHHKDGAHYNIFAVRQDGQRERPEVGMAGLRAMFPDGEANDMNFVLFSTSGVHGSYITIEDIEACIAKYGDEPEFSDDDYPDDYCGRSLTFLIVQPRIVCMRYGNARVTAADIPYLKKLRASSIEAVGKIGSEVE